jgi:uncharacterized Fe-S cluster-containing radical SAM superfamily protein
MNNKCVIPFIGYDYQKNKPCCYLRNYNDKKHQTELLNDHQNNKKSRFCKLCWEDEKIGLNSKRQRYNTNYKNYLNQTHRELKIATISVGNICNLSCVTCSAYYSTSWIKKHNFIYNNETKFDINKDVNISEIKNIHTLDHIEFIGGETLQSRSFWEYLKILDKKTSFSIQTNGTVKLTQQQIDLLKSFSTFNICFSIDGHHKIFEYLRQPANWQNVVNNIKIYKELFGIFRLSYYLTISNLNIFYIDTIMLELFKVLSLSAGLNLVNTPIEFAHNNLPIEIGKIVEKNNPGFFKNKNINWIGTPNLLQKTLENLKKQDEFSGLKFSDSFPELYQTINDFLKK